MTSWSLITATVGGSPGTAAIRRDDGTVVVPDVLRPYDGLKAVLADWDALAPVLAELDTAAMTPVDAVVTGSPVAYPDKLVCVGANYRDHIAEMEGAVVPDGWTPFFFLVPPTTTMIGDGDSILIPEDPSLGVDWEAELAVVIGRSGRDLTVGEALDHVAGYACFSDITARGLLRRRETLGEAFRWDWAASKGIDTFSPMGPVTPSWLVRDPGDLSVRCSVNGVLKQDGSTRDLICGLAEVVSAASRIFTLEPGDVIATGTPAGVGAPRGERLVDGDVVRVEISGLAPLTNPVRVRAPSPSPALAGTPAR